MLSFKQYPCRSQSTQPTSNTCCAPAHHTGLKAWLAMSPEEAHPEALLAALALWPRLPSAAAAACPLLPANCRAPPPGCYDGTAASGSAAAKKQLQQAAAGVFTRQYLEKVRPVLQETTQFSHPRLHLAWGHLLALLLPGFKAVRMEGAAADAPAPAKASSSGPAGHDTAQLAAFWTYGVEQSLFTGGCLAPAAACCVWARLGGMRLAT